MTSEQLEEIAARLLILEKQATMVAESARLLFQDVLDAARSDSVD